MSNASIQNTRTSTAPTLLSVIFLVIVSTLVLLAASYMMFDKQALGAVARFVSVLFLGNLAGMAILVFITSKSGETSVK